MARLARSVVPGRARHVTQRGNRREPIFFQEGDQAIYLDLLAEQTTKHQVQLWAYCLMPNHVHLILVPAYADALGPAVEEAHRRYTNFINARGRWTGQLFQSRFASVVLDDDHFVRAVRYVGLNPVRARLVDAAQQWPWSSVRAHLAAADDAHVRVKLVLDRLPYFSELLEAATDDDFTDLRRAEATGRPLGTEDFVVGLESCLAAPSHEAHTAAGRAARSSKTDRWIGHESASCLPITPLQLCHQPPFSDSAPTRESHTSEGKSAVLCRAADMHVE